jgi:cell wall-associated NlpC family hydrolase
VRRGQSGLRWALAGFHSASTTVTRPTPAAIALAQSTLPDRRGATPSPSPANQPFAKLMQTRTPTPIQQTSGARATTSTMALVHAPMISGGASPSVSRSSILANAQQLLNVPYVWGGTSASGLDCSAYVSKAWGVGRLTTDSLASVSQPISKNDLQAGDALNLTTGRDSGGTGHVRLFDKWANPEKTKMWVYEETPPRSVHHIINWDAAYQPMRRNNTVNA